MNKSYKKVKGTKSHYNSGKISFTNCRNGSLNSLYSFSIQHAKIHLESIFRSNMDNSLSSITKLISVHITALQTISNWSIDNF